MPDACRATIWPSHADRWMPCPGIVRRGHCSAYGTQHDRANVSGRLGDEDAPSPAAAGLPDEDVERVARALWTEGLGPSMFGRKPWEELSPATHKVWRRLAAAALAEMRPTAAEEAVKRVEALAEERERLADHYNAPPGAPIRDEVTDLRAALAPVPHDPDGGERR